MSVLAKFGNRKAILRHGKWICADQVLESDLNEATARWIRETGGPSLKARDQERAVAGEMARLLGGRILISMQTRNRKSSDYFFEQRQLLLDFEFTGPLVKKASA